MNIPPYVRGTVGNLPRSYVTLIGRALLRLPPSSTLRTLSPKLLGRGSPRPERIPGGFT